MCHMRFALRRRQLSAVLAFLVGISVGILLIARTRVPYNPNGVVSVSVPGCNANSEISLNRVLEGRFADFLRSANYFNSSSDLSQVQQQQQQPVSVGPNDQVLKLLHEDGQSTDYDGGRGGRGGSSGKNMILVGVMTAQKYLYTRALAVHDTWAKSVPGHVVFFTSATAVAPAELPVVRLATVDDTYPPQKKSFLMLKYMHDHFLDRYEWFMRTDDDVYVRGHLLEKLLRSVNSSKVQFIGQAGMGNKEEFGQLNLDYNENFCMGGPGIVFSRETLRLMVPHVKECLKNLYSTHEDVEVGRCVRQFAGIPCTWSYEMQNIFYHNSSESLAFTGSLKQKEVHRAITLHPIKQHQHLYRLHNYMQSLRVQELKQRAWNLQRELGAVVRMLNWSSTDLAALMSSASPKTPETDQGQQQQYSVGGEEPEKAEADQDSATDLIRRLLSANSSSSSLRPTPSLSRYFPRDDAEVLKWDFFQRTLFSHTDSNPRRRLEPPLKETLDAIVNDVMDTINKFSKQRGRVIDFKDILYGYRRVSVGHGADYILDLLLVYKKYRGRKMTIPVRKHVYLQQPFTDLEVRVSPTNYWHQESPSGCSPSSSCTRTSSQKVVHFVLPLSGRLDTFRRFLQNFEDVCLRLGERVSLTVVLFPSPPPPADSATAAVPGPDSPDQEDSALAIADLVRDLSVRYPDYRLGVRSLDGQFSRAVALETGASEFGPEDLLFFVDVDVAFDGHFLQRLRLNTVRRKQIFFPVVFSQFDPRFVRGSDVSGNPGPAADHQEGPRPGSGPRSSSAASIDDESGYWRHFGFGIVSLYQSDLKAIGGLDTTIQGWGKEDVDLYTKAVRSNLTVFRAVDPGLVHVFHPIECSRTLAPPQLDMCLGSKASSYASVSTLAGLFYANPDIWKFARTRQEDLSSTTTPSDKPSPT